MLEVLLFVIAYQIIMVHLHIAAQNVQSILTVQIQNRALMNVALIHVQAHVAWTPFVMWSIILQIVHANLAMMAMHLLDAIQS